jgi:hypothetical protein
MQPNVQLQKVTINNDKHNFQITVIAVNVKVPGLILLGCDAMPLGNWFQTHRKNVVLSSSWVTSQKNGVPDHTAEKTSRLARELHSITAVPDTE